MQAITPFRVMGGMFQQIVEALDLSSNVIARVATYVAKTHLSYTPKIASICLVTTYENGGPYWGLYRHREIDFGSRSDRRNLKRSETPNWP